jgi:hypothetical protein
LGAGDEGTHERVETHLVELIDPKIREQTTGDGVLAEFASVANACAVQAKSRPPWPTAIWISPRSAACDFASGLITGSIEEVILLMEQVVRLSLPDPQIAVMYYRIGEVHLLQSRTDEVIASLEGARSANLICARPAYRRNGRQGLKDGGRRLDATVRRKWSARLASRRLGRYDRDGGRCRSVRQIALR